MTSRLPVDTRTRRKWARDWGRLAIRYTARAHGKHDTLARVFEECAAQCARFAGRAGLAALGRARGAD